MKANILVFTVFLAILISSCKRQENKSLAELKYSEKVSDTTMPKGSWKINKELDENGNIIRYDSIYTWSSTGKIDDLNRINIDSFTQSYRSLLNKRFSLIEEDEFSDFFLNDSLFFGDFNNPNFFNEDFDQTFMNLDEMKKRMEKVRREMLKDFFPKEHKE